MELVEALLLHDRVVLIASTGLTPEDSAFLERVNTELGAPALRAVASESTFAHIVDTSDVRTRFRDILRWTFGDKAPTISPTLVNVRQSPIRPDDDYKRELLEVFAAKLWFTSTPDYDGLASYLLREFDASIQFAERRYSVNYLFRVFLFGAIASVNEGSLMVEGLRKFVARLLQVRAKRRAPATIAKRFYDLAAGAFALATRPVLGTSRSATVSLGLAYVFTYADSRNSILGALRHARNDLAAYRKKMDELHTRILDQQAAISDRVYTYNELLGSGASYLKSVMETLNLPRRGVPGLAERVWTEAIDSLAPSPKVTVGEEVEFQASASGTIALGLTRAARRAFEAQKQVSQLNGILLMAEKVANAPGLLQRVAESFPFSDFEPDLALSYEQAAYPFSV